MAGRAFESRRADFPLLVKHPGLHYLDSAATAQKPAVVLDAIREYYETDYANPHRGAYDLSARSTERYDRARRRVARFVGVKDHDTLIFTRGTTESLNLVATAWGRANVRAGDEILITGLEHHANFVPWQQLAIEKGATLRICELTGDGRIDLDQVRALVNGKTRVVAFSHVSNALGTINPVGQIAALARSVGALVVCDGAQAAPHLALNLDELDVDFYAFSGHKMLGPMGVGVLVGKRALLEAMPPYQMGGDMIEFVYDERSTWNVLPHKFEAGTPNVAGAVGLAAACEYLDAIGMAAVRAHEQALLALAQRLLGEIPGVRLYGPESAADRSGVVSFTLDGVHPHDVATILDQDGVCVRAGHHCAQPLMRRLKVPATARASVYLYTDARDVEALGAGVRRARQLFG
ncbi:MAG TPA: SufS family cysteine desulfurase [Gemmatimonadaceae bacterium]|nr:SufS family cysteine desulfurase [Gemmatimonadaceae bacterium]